MGERIAAARIRSPSYVRMRLGRDAMRSRGLLLVVGALVQMGCYNYLPLRHSGLVPSSYVAVTLTESGSDALARYLGPNVLVVRGRYVGPSEAGLTLAVESVESRPGTIVHWAGETVIVPGEFVRSVERRQASWSKTALLAGVSTVGLAVAYW